MNNKEIAKVLEETSILLELRGENRFKSNAYRNAGRVIEGLEEDLGSLAEQGKLREIRGVGEALAEQLTTLVRTGALPYLEELRASIPDGLLEFLRIPGLGPRKAKALHEGLGVSSVAELEYACHEDRVASLKGFGPRSQEKILRGIRNLKRYAGRHLLSEALGVADELLAGLRSHPKVARASIAGSIRRSRETVKDIDILVSVARQDRDEVIDAFLALAQPEEIVARGETKTSVRLERGLPTDLRLVEEGEFASALAYFTGSKEHNTALRGIAKKKGLLLNEYGLFRGDEALPIQGEDDIYRALDLRPIPPELREDSGEIEAAGSGGLPDLIERDDLRGVLHVHTTWSDGRATLEEMVREAERAGFEYVGISDHSQAAFYARGLDPERLRQQKEEIDDIATKVPGITILQGSEVDILPDGRLDFPDEVLATLDYVVASIHSNLEMPEDQMTERVLRALQNPHLTVLGHPSARLLLAREPIRMVLPRVFREAAERGVAIEINANPRRLDLDWRLLRAAKKAGARFSINPDAHSTEAIGDVRYGVGIARKGWIAKEDVINTKPLKEFLALAKR
ncbi:MAG: DNA polymerase/3'-5' exonuclease PolX [Planctomycetota bacterium]|nr:DNA polymerase/3'-5' exonuclease PolX [Planctomycetota bacterium]